MKNKREPILTSDFDYIFTSESVTEGHPDKICDLISDTILDEYLKNDPKSRVACETFFANTDLIIGGEIYSNYFLTNKKIEEIVRKVVKDIGYNFDFNITILLNEQSPEIHQGVEGSEGKDKRDELGAGDQGLMFGLACNETSNLMPMPIYLSHLISKEFTEYRKNNKGAGLLPDGKVQISVKYKNHKPIAIDTVVISMQHDKSMLTLGNLRQFLKLYTKDILKRNNLLYLLNEDTKWHLNPAGTFCIGGPIGDAGLTGRKIVVDTYGGYCPHGGGAFSGKDSSKVDRSGAYMARYIAKNLVAAGISDKIIVQLSYAIGVSEPTSIYVEGNNINDSYRIELEKVIRKVFNLTPQGIIDTLNLENPIYTKTTNYGHFGKDNLTWENIDKVNEIKNEIKNKKDK
jgi:S-adenosylmethionine synthetase